MSGRRIGVDTGGTFTDLVALTPGGLRHEKRPSTPDDPSRAVLEGLAALTAADRLSHGTTVATNALLTGRTAPIALLTTAGFEDVLEIGRQDRPDLYDLEVVRPRALVGADRRLGVDERLAPDGEVERALDTRSRGATGGGGRRAPPGAPAPAGGGGGGQAQDHPGHSPSPAVCCRSSGSTNAPRR